MKLTITQNNLISGLHTVERAVGKNATLPIIENILIKTEESGLRLSATNLEIGVTTWIPAKIEKEGEITVSAKRFVTYIQNLPDKNIEIKTESKSLQVESKSGKADFITEESKDFPVIPEVKGEVKIDLPVNDVKKMLSQTMGATAVTETRPEISGAYWLIDMEEANKTVLHLVATDSYRLAEKKLHVAKLPLTSGDNTNFIIPKNAATELERLLDTEEEHLSVYLDENQVAFKIGKKISIVSRLIEGVFPNYKAIIPESYESRICLKTSDIRDAVNRISLFSSEKTQEVTVKMDPKSKKVHVNASSGETGSGNTEISTTGAEEGGEIEFNLNYRYLIDGLNWVDDEEIYVEAQDSAKPVVLKPKGNDDYLYLIMPLKS